MSYLESLQEAQKRDLHQARGYLDRAEAEKRELTVEERTAWDALNAQMDNRQDHINEVRAAEQRDASVAAAMAQAPEVRTEAAPVEQRSDSDILRAMARGEIRSHVFESRALSTTEATKGPETVPQDFLNTVQAKLLTTGPMLDGSVINLLNTASGNDIKVPVETSRPVGTATAEGATLAVSDPLFSNITLRAHKFSTLVVASRELVEDTGVDLQGFLGGQIGVALGTAVNNALTRGTGTVEPRGVLHALGTAPAVTGGTGVGGAFTADNLITLLHSVDSLYAAQPSAGWMMSRAVMGAVRALKGAEGYLYQTYGELGSPSQLLGYRVVENPYMSAIGTAATDAPLVGKSVAFGDLGAYITRLVGGVELVRSDEAYFLSDQIAWRATIRVGGDLGGGQTDAIKFFRGGTA
jgi:HK97 family phage major capsid protein